VEKGTHLRSAPEKIHPEPMQEIRKKVVFGFYPENYDGKMHGAKHLLPFLKEFNHPSGT
jgi:hypothetical protein